FVFFIGPAHPVLLGLDENGTGICDLQSRKPMQVLKETTPIALAPDGRHLLAWKDGKAILWNIPAAKPAALSFEKEPLSALFSPDSSILATRNDLGRPVEFWNHKNDNCEVAFWDVITGQLLGKPVRVPSFHKASWSRNSKALLLSDSGPFML